MLAGTRRDHQRTRRVPLEQCRLVSAPTVHSMSQEGAMGLTLVTAILRAVEEQTKMACTTSDHGRVGTPRAAWY